MQAALKRCTLDCASWLRGFSRHSWHCPDCDVHLTSLFLCPECGNRWSLEKEIDRMRTENKRLRAVADAANNLFACECDFYEYNLQGKVNVQTSAKDFDVWRQALGELSIVLAALEEER